MADTAFQTQYRDEFIAGFEQRASLLRETVTKEAVIKGNQAVFLVADSGGATAVSRGVNGRIPSRADNQTQNTCVLQEWHDLVRKTGFNIFASQGNQKQMMQDTSMGVVNRKIDSSITDELQNGTITIGTDAVTIPNVSFVMNAVVKVQNAGVPFDGGLTLLVQPSFLAYLMQATEFASADYVDIKPFNEDNNGAQWRDRPATYRWQNLLVMSHPNLPGRGTTAERSFFYHRNAIGHACNTDGLETEVDYDREQAYSWARTTIYMGAKLLQNAGVVILKHDGSAYA